MQLGRGRHGSPGFGRARHRVLGNPSHAQAFDDFMQCHLGEPILLAQGGEGDCSLGLLRARKIASRLPGSVSSHAAQVFLSLGEDGVIELASGFQVNAQASGSSWVDDEGSSSRKGGVAGRFLGFPATLSVTLGIPWANFR